MKKMCVGTYLNILCQAKSSRFTQEAFLSTFLGIYGDYSAAQKDYQGHLKSGKNNISDSQLLKDIDKEAFVNAIRKEAIPYLDETSTKQIILAFKDVLFEDNVGGDINIGYEPGYKKSEILSATKFDLAETLANVFYYCATQTDNISCAGNIKLVKDKNYIHTFDAKVNDIIFDSSPASDKSALTMTVNKKDFNKTFEEVKQVTLALPNNNELRAYVLDVAGNEFDYDDIQKFIRTNIGRYVFSRSKRNEYVVNDDIESISADAISAYKKRMDAGSSTNHFNEIMLYLYLESVLGAPKIYSKMELQSLGGTYESTSSGIHLLMLKNGISSPKQLVFGTTDTLDNLQDAVDSAFAQAVQIKSNRSDEFKLVESTIMNIVPDFATARELRDIILPVKGTGASKPEQAFGVFLGYTIDIPGKASMTKPQYQQAVKQKMEQDIIGLTPYIERKINELDLQSHSFYIYVLPLNNAIVDKDEIMKKALEV